jgi:hypothetical protein
VLCSSWRSSCISVRDCAFSARISSTIIRSWRTCSCRSCTAPEVASVGAESGVGGGACCARLFAPPNNEAVIKTAPQIAEVVRFFTPSSCTTPGSSRGKGMGSLAYRSGCGDKFFVAFSCLAGTSTSPVSPAPRTSSCNRPGKEILKTVCAAGVRSVTTSPP